MAGLDPVSRDFAIRTIYGEAANEPLEGQAAVASVIRNRMLAKRYGGDTVQGVVTARNQFEPWGNLTARERMLSLNTDDPHYQRIGQLVDGVFSGEFPDYSGGSTHFFAPKAQAALGRPAPRWAEGQDGKPIGNHTFYAPEGKVSSGAMATGLPPGSVMAKKTKLTEADIDSLLNDKPASAPAKATTKLSEADIDALLSEGPAKNTGFASPAERGGETTLREVRRDTYKDQYLQAGPGSTAGQQLGTASGAVVRGAGQMIPFYKDVVAATGALVGRGDGQSFGARYRDNYDRIAGQIAADREQSPVASYGGSGLGIAASFPIGSAQIAAARGVAETAGVSAGIGAGMGMAQGASEGDTGQQRINNALSGAALGAGGGAAAGYLFGRMSGNALAPAAPAQPPNALSRAPATEVAAAADRQGISVPKAIASDNMTVQRIGQAVRNVPIVGEKIVRATDDMLSQTGQRLDDVASQYGGGSVATKAGAGDAVRGSVEGYAKTTMPARANELYKAVDEFMPTNATYKLDKSLDVFSNIVARNTQSSLGPGKAASFIQDAVTKPGGLTYEGLKNLRTRVGEMLSGKSLPEGVSQGELKQIYGALSDDLSNAVKTGGGPQAEKAFSRANDWFSAWSNRRQVLGKILDARSDENVIDQIINSAKSTSTGDIYKLSVARKAVGPEEWGQVTAQAVSKLGRDNNGAFSPNLFLRDYTALSERGKDLLFRSTGNKELAQALDDIAKISTRSKEVQKFSNPSGTAQNTVAAGLGAGAFAAPMTTAGTLLGGEVLSRVLSSPATAQSMAKWSKAYDFAARAPSAGTVAGLQIASRNFASTLADKLGVNVSPEQILRAVQGASRATAEQDQ